MRMNDQGFAEMMLRLFPRSFAQSSLAQIGVCFNCIETCQSICQCVTVCMFMGKSKSVNRFFKSPLIKQTDSFFIILVTMNTKNFAKDGHLFPLSLQHLTSRFARKERGIGLLFCRCAAAADTMVIKTYSSHPLGIVNVTAIKNDIAAHIAL